MAPRRVREMVVAGLLVIGLAVPAVAFLGYAAGGDPNLIKLGRYLRGFLMCVVAFAVVAIITLCLQEFIRGEPSDGEQGG